MAQNIIDIAFDYRKTEADGQKVIATLERVYDLAGKLDNIKIGGAGIGELRTMVEQATGAYAGLNKATADYTNAVKQQAAAVTNTSAATSNSTKSFTQNTAAVEENIQKQQQLKKELDSIADARKKLNDFNSKVNFDNNEGAKVQIEQQLLDFSERELQIRKELAGLNTQLQGSPVGDPNNFQGTDLDAAAKAKALEKEQTRQLNAELKTQAQLELATVGSINEAKAAVATLTKERDKLNLTTEEGVQRQTELNKKIDQYNAFIKANNDLQGKQRLNVGNYPSPFAGAFTSLTEELANVKKQLSDPALSGKQLDSLQNQEKLLTQLTQNLNEQFSSTREELRAYQEAAKALGITLGADNKLFNEFAAEVGGAKDEISDLQARINFNASDTKYLDGAVQAVNGLAGAYSAAEGAAQLFGDQDQDVQRGMQKLQALIAITTGLQQVQNAVQSESAVMETILAAKTGLLTAARALLGIKVKEDTAATIADTAAQEANTAAILANAAAAEGSTVAGASSEDVSLIDEAATAQEQLASATETVGTAQEALSTVREAAAPITAANTTATEAETEADNQNAIVKIVLLARAKLLAAAKALLGRASAQNAAATEAEAIAQTQAVIATEAQTAANVELATSAEGVTAAMGGEVVATEAATAATYTFAEAFAATGIGALILAVVAAIGYGIYKLNEYAQASYKAYQANVDFTASIKDQYDILQKQGQLLDEYNRQNLQNLQNETTISEAAGQNRAKQFEQNARLLQQQKQMADGKLSNLIAENEKKYSAEGLKGLDALTKAQNEYLVHYDHYLGQIKVVQEDLRNVDPEDDTRKEALTTLLGDLQKQADGVKAGYDVISKAQSDVATANLDLVKNQVEQIAYLNEEERKITLATTEFEVANVKSRNEQILNDTQSSFDKRRAAIQSNANADIKLAQAQLNDVLNNPTSSNNDRLIAEKQFAEKRIEIIRGAHTGINKVNDEENSRLINADKAMYDTRIKAQQEFYSKASQDPNLSFQQQIDAFDKVQALQQQQITNDYEANKKLRKQSGATDEEMLADEVAFQQQLSDLAQKGADTRLKFIEDNNKRLQAENTAAQSALRNAVKGTYQRDVDNDKDLQEGLSALQNNLRARVISLDEYNRQKEALQKAHDIYQLSSEAEKDKADKDNDNLSFAERLAAAQRYYAAIQALADKANEKLIEARQSEKEATQELVKASADLIVGLGDSTFEKRLNQLQALRDASDEYYQKEIENIQNSTIAEQDKSNRITILKAEQEAADQQSDRKQRDIKQRQARFDKAVQIAEVTAQGIQTTVALFGKAAEAKAEAALLAANPLTAVYAPVALASAAVITATAIISAATTAANIARIAATPIPAYKYGLDGNKGSHYGIYGEAGAELIQKPGFAPYIATAPTIDYLPAHTKITPLNSEEAMQKAMYRYNLLALNAGNAKSSNNEAWDIARYQTGQFSKAIKSIKVRDNRGTFKDVADAIAHAEWKRKRTNW